MFQTHPHHLRHAVQPGISVVHHQNRGAAWLQNTVDFCNHGMGVRSVLDHTMGVCHIKRVLRICHLLAIHNMDISLNTIHGEILSAKINRLLREINPGDNGTALCKPCQVSTHPAPHLQ
jgi:hypothetical protein